MPVEAGSVVAELTLNASQYDTAIQKAERQMQTFEQTVAANSKKMEQSLGLVDKQMKLWELTTHSATKAMQGKAVQVDSIKQKMGLLEKAIEETNTELQASRDKYGSASDEAKLLENQLLDLTIQHAELNKELGNFSFGSRLQETGKRMQDIGQSMFTRVTLPLLGVATAATKVSMDFEAGMSRVSAISGATGDALEQLEDQALELGAKTAFSAKEAAAGMENLASAGFAVEEIMAAMPGMLDLAAAGGVDIAEASDIASAALRGFGLAAGQAGHVADVLARAAGDTNAGIIDMGYAMKYVAPIASAMGLSIEEVSAAIGLMSNAGIKGEQAGTTLRASLTRLANPTDEAGKMMRSLGINAFDAEGRMRPLAEVIEQLQQGTSNLTEQQRQQAVATIFGTEAMSGMLALMSQGSDELARLTESFENSEGAADAMAKTMQDNLKGSLEEMKGSLETAGIQIGEVLTPMIRDAAKWITEMTNRFSELDPEAQRTIVKMGLLALSMAPALKLGGSLASSIGSISKLLGTYRAASAAATAATTASTAAATANATASAALSRGLGATLNPIRLFQSGIKGASTALTWLAAHPIVAVIGALALLGAAFVSARNKAKQAMEDMTNAELGKIQEGYEQEKQLAFGAVDAKIEAANTAFEKRKALLDKEYQAAKETIQKETETLKQGSQDRLDLLKREHDAVIQQLRDEYGVYKEASNSKMDLAREEARNAIDLLEEQADKARELHKERIKQLEDEALAALDAETQAQIKALEDQIDGIDELTKAEDKAERERRDREKVALLESQIANEQDAERKTELQQDLQDLLYDIERRALLDRRDAQKEALREQIAQVKTASEEQKRLIKESLNAELEEKKRVETAKLDEALARIDEEKVAIQEALTEKLIKLEEERAEKERIENAKHELAKAGLDKELASLEEAIALKQEKVASEYAAKLEHEERMYKALTDRLADEKTAVTQHYEDLKASAEAYERAANRAKAAMDLARESQEAQSAYWYQQGTLPGDIAGNALGTNYWRGGLTWVGEQGPELIELPRGSKVYTNQQSERMAATSGGVTQHITINSPTPLTPSEVARKTKQASQHLAMEWGL